MARTINVCKTSIKARTRITDAFLMEAKRYTTLSAEEELALINRYQREGDESAKDSIVNHNLRFIYSLASKFAKGNDVDDLISCAAIGMIRAMQDFDPTKGFRFLSYAVHWMREEISEYYDANGQTVRNKIGCRLSARASRMQDKYFAENGRYMTDDEIVDAINAEIGRDVAKIGSDVRTHKITSINNTIDEDGTTVEESGEIAVMTASRNEVEIEIERESTAYNLDRLLSTLSERDRKILELSVGMTDGIERDDKQIAEIIGCSAERVRQIRLQCYEKLRGKARKIFAA